MANKTSSATAVWTGDLQFGLITIPIKIYAAARDAGVSFNQVHVCKGPALDAGVEDKRSNHVTKINQQNFCSCCNAVIPYESLQKGFEIADGQFAVIDPAELEALKPKSSKLMEITEFVSLADVDPLYFEKSYYVIVDQKKQDIGRKPYEVLFQTMKGTGTAGVAKYTSRGKEYNAFIRPFGKGLMIHTMYAEAEVREIPEFNDSREDVKVSDGEVRMAKALLESLTVPFDKNKLVDNYTIKVTALIESKKDDAAPAGSPKTPRTEDDLMTQLAASLYQAKEKKTAKV
jgi:DNA end-binding protein Ku